MSVLTRSWLNSNNDEHYEALINRQAKNDKNHDTPGNDAFITVVSNVAVQCKDGGTVDPQHNSRKRQL